MVCPECGHVTDLTAPLLRAVRAKTALPCHKCREADLRMRIMLYDDGEGADLHPSLIEAIGGCESQLSFFERAQVQCCPSSSASGARCRHPAPCCTHQRWLSRVSGVLKIWVD